MQKGFEFTRWMQIQNYQYNTRKNYFYPGLRLAEIHKYVRNFFRIINFKRECCISISNENKRRTYKRRHSS